MAWKGKLTHGMAQLGAPWNRDSNAPSTLLMAHMHDSSHAQV